MKLLGGHGFTVCCAAPAVPVLQHTQLPVWQQIAALQACRHHETGLASPCTPFTAQSVHVLNVVIVFQTPRVEPVMRSTFSIVAQHNGAAAGCWTNMAVKRPEQALPAAPRADHT